MYKKLGLNINAVKNNVTIEIVKSKDIIIEIKEALLRKLYDTLNNENKIAIKPPQSSNPIYKYCVLKGNNSAIVKGLFRQRWWWYPCEKEDYLNSNVLWTQWKKQEFISKLLQSKAHTFNEIHPLEFRICNHLEYNYVLGNKKCMYYNLKSYYEIQKKEIQTIVPLTFHVENVYDPEYSKFRSTFRDFEK